jgi:hypothetical protein
LYQLAASKLKAVPRADIISGPLSKSCGLKKNSELQLNYNTKQIHTDIVFSLRQRVFVTGLYALASNAFMTSMGAAKAAATNTNNNKDLIILDYILLYIYLGQYILLLKFA